MGVSDARRCALRNGLEKKPPGLERNWRWQMCLVRAVYDSYTRHRLIYESALEDEANAKLAEAPDERPAGRDGCRVDCSTPNADRADSPRASQANR